MRHPILQLAKTTYGTHALCAMRLSTRFMKFYDRKVESRAFNKHRRPTKQIGYFAHRSWILFPLKLEAGNKVLN